MFCELVQTLFPKWKLALYPDELKVTKHYVEVTDRSKAWWDRDGIAETCAVGPVRPGIAIDHSMDGPVSLTKVEIGRRKR